jgi:hypothetical protein
MKQWRREYWYEPKSHPLMAEKKNIKRFILAQKERKND